MVDVDVDHGHALGAVHRLFIPPHHSKHRRRFVVNNKDTGTAQSNTSEFSCMPSAKNSSSYRKIATLAAAAVIKYLSED